MALDIDLTPRRVDLAAERFDAAIRIGPLDDSTLPSRRFATVSAHLYASPDYLARFGRSEHPGDLERHACLPLPHMRGRARLERSGVRLDVPMPGRVQVNHQTGTLGWVKSLPRATVVTACRVLRVSRWATGCRWC